MISALGGEADVVEDPEPDGRRNAWRTYRECLDSTPDWASHRLVVQDDARPCSNFVESLTLALDARPDRVLVLWHGGQPNENVPILRLARERGHAWALHASTRWVPAVAVVWPTRLVCEVVCWVEEQSYPVGFTADDEILGRALQALGEPVLVAVPSLVEHDDGVASIATNVDRRGPDPARVAVFFDDPNTADWTTGDI